jgi:hypothetical protein
VSRRVWAGIDEAVHKQRDDVIRSAYAAGVPVNKIFLITGIARTTIQRVLDGESAGEG